ncbi:hypothetical protein [Agrobacterium sp. SORGH_AS 787]
MASKAGGDEDIITNNDEGAPPVPFGQSGDREQGPESDDGRE